MIFDARVVHARENLPEGFIAEVLPLSWKNPVEIQFDIRGYGYLREKEGRVWVLEQEDQPMEPCSA